MATGKKVSRMTAATSCASTDLLYAIVSSKSRKITLANFFTLPSDLTVTYKGAALPKLNISATAAPGVGDDSADGYAVDSVWVDVTNDVAYRCVDATAGAAVWLRTVLTASQVDTVDVAAAIGDAITRAAGFTPTATLVGASGSINVITSASSTFSGWAGDCGSPQNFDRVSFPIVPWSPTEWPTLVRVQIRNTDCVEVLADATVAVHASHLQSNQAVYLTVDFDRPVMNPSDAMLWFCFWCNGRSGYLCTDGSGLRKYATAMSVTDTSLIVASDGFVPYVQFYRVDRSTVRVNGLQGIKNGLTTLVAQEGFGGKIVLPAVLYGCTGREFNVYVDNLPLSYYDQIAWNVTCNRGGQEQFRFTWTPEDVDAGTRSIIITNYLPTDATPIAIATKTVSVTTAAAAAGTGITRKLLTIGDSTIANGIMLAELVHLFADDGVMTLTQVGTQTADVLDCDGTYRTVNHEGYSGRTFNWMYTDAASPFVNAGAFDFANYLTANAITLSALDWVIFQLGINDIFANETDVQNLTTIQSVNTQLDAMITNIQAAVANVRIGISLGAPAPASQDAFSAYSAQYDIMRYRRHLLQLYDFLISEYDARTAEKIYVFAPFANVDAINNWGTTSVHANARNPTHVIRQYNGVHPGTYGYHQVADAYYCLLKAIA